MAGEIEIEKTKTPQLLDLEHENEAQRQARIGRVALEIEAILLREDLTMGELAEVMDLFNARAHNVFSQTKLKTVKESYDRQN